MSGKGLSCGDRRDLAVEVAELHEATWIDVHRKGVRLISACSPRSGSLMAVFQVLAWCAY